ncbi:AF1514 family protein [Desulfomarina sp.]
MQKIHITLEGINPDFDTIRKMTDSLALVENEYATLVAWNDRERDIHSPRCLKCEFDDAPGWEIYGRNHGGRLRISVNNDQFVLIYS